MSYSNINEWRIIDKEGNELKLTDAFPLGKPFTVKAVKYDPDVSALEVIKRAIEVEFLD